MTYTAPFRSVLAVLSSAFLAACAAPARGRGDWPMARHDSHLSGRQTLAGAMKDRPVVRARYETPKTAAALTPVDLDRDARPDLVLAFRSGLLRAYDLSGRRLWEASSRGLTYTGFLAASDLDADGKTELVLQTGHAGMFAPAVAVLDAADGRVRARIPFEAGCFSWILKVGPWAPGVPGEQILLVNSMQVDAASGRRGARGAVALWSFEKGADHPAERWFYDAAGYEIKYPAMFLEDVSGDGRPDLFVTDWCHLYRIDLGTGKVMQEFGWDPQGANKRHYGWNQLVDMDGDGDPDYVCVSGAKHVDMLRNEGGLFSLGWTVGWPDEVTLSRYDMAHGPWPAADLDGDGRREAVFSVFNEGDAGRWKLHILDGSTGAERAVLDDLIMRSPVDLDGDGGMELLVTRHRERNRDAWEAVEVVDWREGKPVGLAVAGATGWEGRAPETPSSVFLNSGGIYLPEEVVSEPAASGGRRMRLRFGGTIRAVSLGAGGEIVTDEAAAAAPPASPASPPPADLSRIPADGGAIPNAVLAADLDGDGVNEVILAGNPAKVLTMRGGRLEPAGEIPAECLPAIADLDGDGTPELVVGDREGRDLRVSVLDAKTRAARWRRALPDTQMSGIQYGLTPMSVAVGRFTGGPGLDVYVYVNKPGYRAMVLRGGDGGTVWERSDPMPGTSQPEGYGPYNGPAAVYDVDGNGADDLLFASPSFLACAAGPDAALLRAPRMVLNSRGTWAGYSSPVVCPQPDGPPVLQLMNAWAMTGAVPLGTAAPEWPQFAWTLTQEPAEWRSGAEVVFRDARRPGRWCVAWPDQGGRMICREVETGAVRWTHAMESLCQAPAAGDVDGDGRDELVVAGSDGRVTALRDAGDRAEVVWQAELGMPAGPPLLVDVDGDGRCDGVVGAADGVLYVLGAGRR